MNSCVDKNIFINLDEINNLFPYITKNSPQNVFSNLNFFLVEKEYRLNTEKYYGCIYLIYNLVNNKIYIGQTKRKLEERIREHINRGVYPISKAFKKYGAENFRCYVIGIASSFEESNSLEKSWIKYFKKNKFKLYNMTEGGEGAQNYSFKKEVIEKKSKSVSKYYTSKFYLDYNVKDILDYLINNEVTFEDCVEKFNISSSNKLKTFIKKEFIDLYHFVLKRSHKIKGKRGSYTSKLRGTNLRPEAKIQIDINTAIDLLESGKSFKETSDIMKIDRDILKKRIKDSDISLYNKYLKQSIIIRNKNVNLSHYKAWETRKQENEQ